MTVTRCPRCASGTAKPPVPPPASTTDNERPSAANRSSTDCRPSQTTTPRKVVQDVEREPADTTGLLGCGERRRPGSRQLSPESVVGGSPGPPSPAYPGMSTSRASGRSPTWSGQPPELPGLECHRRRGAARGSCPEGRMSAYGDERKPVGCRWDPPPTGGVTT